MAAAPGIRRTTQSPSGQVCVCGGPSLITLCSPASAPGRPSSARPPPRGLRLISGGRRRALRGLTGVRVWHGLQWAPVRLVIARCSVDYAGRLSAHLALATRLLIVKADSSVLVHSDGGSYKPLNWMPPPCRLAEEPGRWVVTGKSGETLTIEIEEIVSDSSFDLGVDPGLIKDGVESHLQELLAAQMHVLGEGWRLVRREFPTPIGPVDLMCRDALGTSVPIEVNGAIPREGTASRPRHWAVEVKRHAGIAAVEQLCRYVELLGRDPLLRPVGGVLAAQTITPQARTLAEDRGLRCVVLDYDELRGAPRSDLTLF